MKVIKNSDKELVHEIETKLKNIAERLNKGQKIDWKDMKQYKIFIFYDK